MEQIRMDISVYSGSRRGKIASFYMSPNVISSTLLGILAIGWGDLLYHIPVFAQNYGTRETEHIIHDALFSIFFFFLLAINETNN